MKLFNKSFLNFWENLDFIMIAIILALAVFGIVIVYSATGSDPNYLNRKVIQVTLGITLMVLAANTKVTAYNYIAWPLLAITIILLTITLFFGITSKGATRWISLGIVRFQPSELAKIAVPLTTAIYLGSKNSKLKFSYLATSLVICITPTLLIVLEPDLGTSILVLLSGLVVVFLTGLSWRIIILGLISIALFIPLFWKYGMHDYQKTRVLTIFNPEADPLGAGYHVIQSKIAIGSGGIFGKGLMSGTQVQLNFLPESHTDFIFSVLSEELGLIGVTLLFTLYFFLILRMFWIASNSDNSTSRLLSSSQGFIFCFYIIVNIGMVSGLLPVVGVPLPLISYGGTSFVSLCLTFGVVMGYYKQTQKLSKTFKKYY